MPIKWYELLERLGTLDVHPADQVMRSQLPKDGEIPVEMVGFAKAASKGGGKDLAVQANEKVDILRTTDCPKGKFLVRNSDGACECKNRFIHGHDLSQKSKSIYSKILLPEPVKFSPRLRNKTILKLYLTAR